MYYNKSTFPIFLYPMKKSRFSFNKIYQNLTFLTNKENFDIEFLESIKSKEKQDLIGFLMACLPSIIITNFRKFSREELRIQNTIDDSLYELCNLRIDFKSVNEKLVELESNNLVIKCRSTLIITELCHFVFQYIFIQLSKSIYATEFKNKKFLFDIKTNSLLHKKFSDNLPISIDKLIVQDNFINGYIESFKDFEKINWKLVEAELIYMSDTVNQKKRLKSIFDRNISFSKQVTERQKNIILVYFFKNVTSKFYFKYLDENHIEDYEVGEAFRTYRKRV